MSLFASRSLLPLVALLAACATKDASKSANASDSAHTVAAAKPHQMTVVATDYKFDAPDAVPSGMMTVHLVDNGSELHQVAFVKLNDGKTISDVANAMKNAGPMPSWAVDYGGVNPSHPGGGMSTTTQMLEPGNYAMLCFVPSPDGIPHFAKGMVRPLTVTASTDASAPAPTEDIVMTLSDYTFTTSKPITAGRHTIKIENTASQSHELVLARLQPGKKAEDLPAWAEKMSGPPPAVPIGGVPAIAKGSTAYITADFTPGDYALVCFVPDAKDGKPHFVHGMVKQVHVE
ncbi:MAG TPA: hypothetical protein VLI43_00925 [Gemmatimonadaceae bacterium]|nr:hypothetical protein [Gemmatimonadaceae bacterium]